MSKCQKNKYFIGTCTGSKTENKAFQQDLSKLMAARNAQDSKFQASVDIKESVTTVTKAIVKFQGFKKSDIDTVLDGDF